MKIFTGKQYISLGTLISVLSLSLVVNIPGLAITPIQDTLVARFGASPFEVQLLTMLPNLFIIPFMLLSGHIILRFGKTNTTAISLLCFLFSGIGFFFANSMIALIVLSCILGSACGVIIPIAASLVSDLFEGKQRTQQLGNKSATANVILVLATFAVGAMAGHGSWRLPFVMYLIPIIPLFFLCGIHRAEKLSKWREDCKDAESPCSKDGNNIENRPANFDKRLLAALMGSYFLLTFATMVLPYYLSYDEKILNITDFDNGIITAIFYFMIFLGGIGLLAFVRIFHAVSYAVALILLALGMILMVMHVPMWGHCAAAALIGLGYGVIQPLIYDKTAQITPNKRYTTMALSWVMCMNYLSIAITPVIIRFAKFIVGTNSNIFPFWLCGGICLIFAVLALIKRHSFNFSTNFDDNLSQSGENE